MYEYKQLLREPWVIIRFMQQLSTISKEKFAEFTLND